MVFDKIKNMKNLTLLIACVTFGNTVFSQNSDSAKLYYQKAIVEKEAKRYLVASNYLDKAIDFDTKYKEAYLENGYVNLAMRKTDVAKGHFTKLYELDPGNKAAIKELTDLYYSYHQYEKAIEFANKCVGFENAERIIAMSSYKQEDYATAVKGLLNVIAKNPADAEANYTLGRCFLDMEQYTKAVPYYNKAVQLDATKNVWMNELGLLYYNLNDFKNAKTFFLKALENGYPASNDFNENLGYAYIYSGEFEKGEKLLLAILAKKPGNKDILRDIAEAYYQQKMYDKSLDFCQQLITLDAKDAKALYQAGSFFIKSSPKTGWWNGFVVLYFIV
jgi:tetratricopeptide (TPR) repeat protein